MFSLEVVSASSITEVKQNFLAIGIELSFNDLKQLAQYQNKVLQHYSWIELDSLRFKKIIDAFLVTGHLHYGNLLEVLKKAILSYYTLRSEFDCSLVDDELCSMIANEFVKQLNLGRDFNLTDLRKQLRKSGVGKRKQRWENDLRTIF